MCIIRITKPKELRIFGLFQQKKLRIFGLLFIFALVIKHFCYVKSI